MRFVVLALAVSAFGCANSAQAPGRDHVDESVRSRTGFELRPEETSASLPPGVSLHDGLAPDEAVAIALWNNPAFEASLADLGVARADLVDAGLLKNPVLSLLFPLRSEAAGMDAPVRGGCSLAAASAGSGVHPERPGGF